MKTKHAPHQPTPIHRARKLAERYLSDEPALRSSLEFGPYVHQGQGDGPAMIIGDQAEIPLLHGVFQSRRDYRVALLAKPSDVVIVRHRDEAYETYLNKYLGIADVTFLEAPNILHSPIAQEALSWGELGDTLDMIACTGVSFTLKPYLTTQSTWRLAKHLGEISGHDMHVCGPSPRISRRANDKLWFAELIRQLFGKDATPPTMRGYNLAAAAAEIAYLAQTSDQIVAKVPDSAGSAGNITLRSADLVGKSQSVIQALLQSRLQTAGWTDSFPILIGVWEREVICSPSVQLWVPGVADGPPRVDGLFEQQTRDAEGVFVGASTSSLPRDLQDQLSDDAIVIATVLQELGYFGQCSFDAVICRMPDRSENIHWIECNGRWGGVSIPMRVAKSLKGGRIPDGFLVVQEYRPDLPQIETSACLALFDELLFRKGQCEEGLVISSPPTSPDGMSVNLLVIGSTARQADLLLKEAYARLTGSQAPSMPG